MIGTIATRLDDIASGVATEAAQLTQGLRAIGEHSRDITRLAADLELTARAIDEGLKSQLAAVAEARREFADNRPALDALTSSADVIASMSGRIREIASQSRLLSLNARIEAARSATGTGFGVVAEAMGQLASQTRTTTNDIDDEATHIERSVVTAGRIIQTGTNLADHQHVVIGEVATTTVRQRLAAEELRRLTAETVDRVDNAAMGIGRVASAASIVGLLARQMKTLAQDARPSSATNGV